MDNYDQYAALKGASAPTADRIRNLNAYAALFDKMGMGGANTVGRSTWNTFSGGGFDNPQLSQGQIGRNAMEWATKQMDRDSQEQMLRQPPPDYFSGQPAQPQAPQNDFTNHLRMMLQSPLRQRFTMGVRG